MTQSELSHNFYVELAVALAVMIAFVISAGVSIRERHRDRANWHVLLGSAIYGGLVGLVVGFVIVPLRALLLDGALPPQVAAGAGFGFLAIMFTLRSGVLFRTPLLGPQVRAFRRASLRRTIEKAEDQLARLTRDAVRTGPR